MSPGLNLTVGEVLLIKMRMVGAILTMSGGGGCAGGIPCASSSNCSTTLLFSLQNLCNNLVVYKKFTGWLIVGVCGCLTIFSLQLFAPSLRFDSSGQNTAPSAQSVYVM